MRTELNLALRCREVKFAEVTGSCGVLKGGIRTSCFVACIIGARSRILLEAAENDHLSHLV